MTVAATPLSYLYVLDLISPILHLTSISYISLAPLSAQLPTLRTKFRLSKRIPRLIVYPQPDLLLLLRRHMLDPNLLGMALHELPDKSRIPQLTRDAQIFAATH